MKAWEGTFTMPLKGRSQKPRVEGFTMVIDKGLGLRATKDLLEMAAEWIDDIKLTFGTSAFYSEEILKRKIDLIRNAGVEVMPGGTFLEVAIWQGVYDGFLRRAKDLGFTMIEVSDGTIQMDAQTRARAIGKALDAGFRVISEVGKKDPAEKVPLAQLHEQIAADLANGAFKVIVEAREAGKGVGIYDEEGRIKEEEVEAIVSGVADPNCLLWEAPLKSQQQQLILRFGPNVNLGNIPPEDVLALEALRQGLRGDTLKQAYWESQR
ncbi:MAG TPA: phosphosulfolactate synthase [Armatimonadetes bacterium]|nr:phosphosulfolactate synthase [Armatimonadota bacterium]